MASCTEQKLLPPEAPFTFMIFERQEQYVKMLESRISILQQQSKISLVLLSSSLESIADVLDKNPRIEHLQALSI